MKPALKLGLITVPLVAAGALLLGNIVANKAPPARVELVERATPVRVIYAREMAVRPSLSGYGLVSPSRTYEAIAQVGGTPEFVNPALRKGEILPEGAFTAAISRGFQPCYCASAGKYSGGRGQPRRAYGNREKPTSRLGD